MCYIDIVMILIYKITNVANGKLYIGRTIQSLKRRWISHCVPSSGCLKLHNAIQKYGKSKFVIELITICATQEVANFWEKSFITQLDTVKNGYNIELGGFSGGHPNPNKGKPRPLEVKKRISLSRRGQPITAQTKLKMSLAKKGKTNHREGLSFQMRPRLKSPYPIREK